MVKYKEIAMYISGKLNDDPTINTFIESKVAEIYQNPIAANVPHDDVYWALRYSVMMNLLAMVANDQRTPNEA